MRARVRDAAALPGSKVARVVWTTAGLPGDRAVGGGPPETARGGP